MFKIVNRRATDDGRTPEHGYTISSSCEPNGSGELKINTKVCVPYQNVTWIPHTVAAILSEKSTVP